MQIRRIDDRISVSPQIDPADVTTLAAEGFLAIINNRPDAEEAGQPEGAAVGHAAETLGLDYTAIPIDHSGFSHAKIEAMRAALDAAGGPVLAFCRSGTRSAHLWALAEAKAGGDPETITAKAAAAGYDLSGIRPLLDKLSSGRA
ncbi:TIGR01244 family sulfur transferase [Hephaestia sp. GCM10023244]|uniref:TIGR01244 family sulfur transferase n=1 Tax=unclassified Hephaestia TaxID=2631281 RepID=UPI002077136A|nr:TIGR01244 family sulfur transferase [Hephaestia sp. MAHUQ-44]MCM8730440.1 TIGR01244 family sulfur transferase [Hephaestia sp. MAHUQ-44]